MSDHRVDKKHLSVIVIIKAPRVGGSVSHRFEDFPGWMIAPDAATYFHPFALGRPRYADGGDPLNSLPSIKPAIRTPAQAIGDGVADGAGVPPIQDHD